MPQPDRALAAIRQAQTLLAQAAAHLSDGQPQNATHDLPPMQAAIITVATALPASARTLARLSARRYNSRFREALRSLTDNGLLIHTSRGYRRA
jgi:hypothetical protein